MEWIRKKSCKPLKNDIGDDDGDDKDDDYDDI
jgi:hypothetical protein